jgi:hypothetical protein
VTSRAIKEQRFVDITITSGVPRARSDVLSQQGQLISCSKAPPHIVKHGTLIIEFHAAPTVAKADQ